MRGATVPGAATGATLAYAGQFWDADLGLSYAQQRWYAPGVGRFLSEDPLGATDERLMQPGRLQTFLYAAGNPLLYVDPEGLDVGQAENLQREFEQAPQVAACMKSAEGVDPRNPAFRNLAYSCSAMVSPDGRGFAGFDKEGLDRLCSNGDASACDVLAENELRQLGGGALLAVTPGAAARIMKPASKILPMLMKAWLAVSVATMQHDAPGGVTVPDPVTYTAQHLVTNAATCWGGQGQTPARWQTCIAHGTDAVTLGLASLETKPGWAARDALSRLEFGYTSEQLARTYSFPGPLPVRLKPPPAKAPIWTSTNSKTPVENAYRHFKDHGAEVGAENALDYVRRAQDFLRNPPSGTLTRIRSNGDVVRYNPSTNTFGVMDATGAPRTFFKPDPAVHGKPSNLDYFNGQ